MKSSGETRNEEEALFEGEKCTQAGIRIEDKFQTKRRRNKSKNSNEKGDVKYEQIVNTKAGMKQVINCDGWRKPKCDWTLRQQNKNFDQKKEAEEIFASTICETARYERGYLVIKSKGVKGVMPYLEGLGTLKQNIWLDDSIGFDLQKMDQNYRFLAV